MLVLQERKEKINESNDLFAWMDGSRTFIDCGDEREKRDSA